MCAGGTDQDSPCPWNLPLPWAIVERKDSLPEFKEPLDFRQGVEREIFLLGPTPTVQEAMLALKNITALTKQ